MVNFKEMVRDSAVVFLSVGGRKQTIDQLVEVLSEKFALHDRNLLLRAVIRREKISSTGIGMGIAIPHAKIPIVDRFMLAIGIKNNGPGINWPSIDGSLVKLVLMIFGPENKQDEYLQILSQLTTTVKNERKLSLLINSKTKEEVVALFEENFQ